MNTGEDLRKPSVEQTHELQEINLMKTHQNTLQIHLSPAFSHYKALLSVVSGVTLPLFAHQQPVETLSVRPSLQDLSSRALVLLSCIIWQMIKSSSCAPASWELTALHWLKHVCLVRKKKNPNQPSPNTAPSLSLPLPGVSTPSVSPCVEFSWQTVDSLRVFSWM